MFNVQFALLLWQKVRLKLSRENQEYLLTPRADGGSIGLWLRGCLGEQIAAVRVQVNILWCRDSHHDRFIIGGVLKMVYDWGIRVTDTMRLYS